MGVEPFVCPIRVNGVGLLVSVYPTTDRSSLPGAHRAKADPTDDGRGLFVAEHVAALDAINGVGPRSNGSTSRSVAARPAAGS
jgi:hypothetical protein